MSETQGPYITRKDLFEALLKIYSQNELEQIVRVSLRASAAALLGDDKRGNGLTADVIIRFKGGAPRWIGVEEWMEAMK